MTDTDEIGTLRIVQRGNARDLFINDRPVATLHLSHREAATFDYVMAAGRPALSGSSAPAPQPAEENRPA